jgi:hypothetical protein
MNARGREIGRREVLAKFGQVGLGLGIGAMSSTLLPSIAVAHGTLTTVTDVAGIKFRPRTGESASHHTIFGGYHSLPFEPGFLSQFTSWASRLATLSRNAHLLTGSWSNGITWLGESGTHADRPVSGTSTPSMHTYARAFDLDAVRFADGFTCDMAYSWRSGVTTRHKRCYVAVAASVRRRFNTVLTAWYNSDHSFHIHLDNGATLGPLRRESKADTVLVQSICRYLNGSSISIDGSWGSGTERAFKALLPKTNCGGDPTTSVSALRTFCDTVTVNGVVDQPLGHFGPGC